jgi:hypothetical protein
MNQRLRSSSNAAWRSWLVLLATCLSAANACVVPYFVEDGTQTSSGGMGGDGSNAEGGGGAGASDGSGASASVGGSDGDGGSDGSGASTASGGSGGEPGTGGAGTGTGGMGTGGDDTGTGGSGTVSCNPSEDDITDSEDTGESVSGTGPHEVVIETNSDDGIRCGTIFRPQDLGR